MVDRTNALIIYDINSQNIGISLLIVAIFFAAILNYGSVKQLYTSEPVIGTTTMGGTPMGGGDITNEPPIFMVSYQACAILERAEWLQYLNRLQDFHEGLRLEFLHNLHNGSTTIKGRSIIVSEVVITEVTELPVEGTKWTENHVLLHNAIEELKYSRIYESNWCEHEKGSVLWH